MNIVIFTHPGFLGSQSMPRYARFIAEQMHVMGHTVKIWRPKPYFYRLPALKKWMGYLDQFLLFPSWVKKQMKQEPEDTLYVFSDHALGPWVPLVKHKPHIIHCHDFLAQRSALGEIPQNPTKLSGRIYQGYIRRGYRQGKNFISISQKTQADLHRFLTDTPETSEVLHNAVNPLFRPLPVTESRKALSKHVPEDLSQGYWLHVGGNQWYKNRIGVVKLYAAWCKRSRQQIPLILIGHKPNKSLIEEKNRLPYGNGIHFVSGLTDEEVNKAYCGATALVFPSLAEGFGWPIVEAMASGSPVITTNDTPMTEVGGNAAIYLPTQGHFNSIDEWATHGAEVLHQVYLWSPEKRAKIIQEGLSRARQFNSHQWAKKLEHIYNSVITI